MSPFVNSLAPLKRKLVLENHLPVIAVIVGSFVGDISQLTLTSWISFGSNMMSLVRDDIYGVKEFDLELIRFNKMSISNVIFQDMYSSFFLTSL